MKPLSHLINTWVFGLFAWGTLLSASENTWKNIIFYSSHSGSYLTQDSRLSSDPNPQSELQATLRLFSETQLSLTDPKRPECLYPSRYAYLKHLLQNHHQAPCLELQRWKSQIKSLSLVYTQGYLGNPASFFGHTFLKLNTDSKKLFQNPSVNFGAEIPPKTSPLAYIYQGVTGGFEAKYEVYPFLYSHYNYTQKEARDLYEYELKLNTEELDKILNQIWEVQQLKFTYYFTSRNCAYFIARIIEQNSNFKLTPEGLFVYPIEIFAKLKKQDIINKSLHLSVSHKIQNRFNQLNQASQLQFRAALNKSIQPQQMDTPSLKLLLQYRQNTKDSTSPYLQDIQKIQEELINRSVPYQVESGVPQETLNARHPQYLEFGTQGNHQNLTGLSLKYRLGYNDLLDYGNYFQKWSHFELLKFQLRFYDSNFSLNQLTLIEFTNLKPINKPLQEQRLSWGLSSGWRSNDLKCQTEQQSCLSPYFNFSTGIAWEFMNSNLFYSMLHLELRDTYAYRSYSQLSPRFGVLLADFFELKLMGELYYAQGLDNPYDSYPGLQVSQSWEPYPEVQLRSSYLWEQTHLWELGLQVHW